MSFFEMDGRLVLILFTFALSISSVESACVPPREGMWTVTLYEPQIYEPRIKFLEPLHGYLHLRRHPELPNVYTGPSTFINTAFGQKFSVLFLLHAVYDEEDCRLHGTSVAPALLARDEINWIVEGGEKMHGLYVPKAGDNFPLPYTCIQTAEFAGEEVDVDVLSLLKNAGHSYIDTTSQHSF